MGQAAEESEPVAEAVAIGQRRETVGAFAENGQPCRQQKWCGLFGRRLEIDRLGLHVDSKDGGAGLISPAPPERKLKADYLPVTCRYQAR